MSLWQAAQWLQHPYAYFRRQAGKVGLTWRTWLPGLGRVLISGDPEILGQLAHHPGLSGGKAHRALRACLGEDHLIVMSGEAHRQRSRWVRQALTAFASDHEVAGLTRQEFAKVPLQKSFSLHQVAYQISLRVMLKGLLGAHPEQPIVGLVDRFQASFSNPLLLYLPALRRDWGAWSPWGRLLRRRQELQQALLRQLDQAPENCIGTRLAAHLSAESLAVELLALLMFGHETTAATFAWCYAWLTPESARRLPDNEYAYAFVEECLRVSPAVAQLTRVADYDLSLGPWQVPQGSVVMPAIPLAHDQFPQADRFDPERFLGATPPPHSYCPFGLGQRLCPGKSMALRQIVVMLQTVAQEFEVKLQPGYRARAQRKLFLVVPHGGTPAVRLR